MEDQITVHFERWELEIIQRALADVRTRWNSDIYQTSEKITQICKENGIDTF